jgi:hypothetical protein
MEDGDLTSMRNEMFLEYDSSMQLDDTNDDDHMAEQESSSDSFISASSSVNKEVCHLIV